MDSNYNYEEELMIKIAWYYYIENLTQQEIAKILGINRIKILRLLDKAKENGLITFQIRNSNAKRFHMENTFKELFHLNDILIIPSIPSRIHVVEIAAISAGSILVSARTLRTQPLASSQLYFQSKSILPGKRGSSLCVHSCWEQPIWFPFKSNRTARTLPVPASIAIK